MKSKWFAYTSENEGAKLKLLLFPYAGGSASMFVQWKKDISKAADVYPVLYPFREARRSETLPDTVTELGRMIAAENEDVFKGRYAVFGHCAGASVLYETVCEARRLYGTEPEFIIASGAEPPGYSLEEMRSLETADESEFLEYLIKSGFADESVRSNKGFLTYYLPIIRADFQMLFSYTPDIREKFNCPIYLFRGEDDNVIDTSRLREWQEYTAAPVSEIVFSGGHYYFTPSNETVCGEINNILNVIKE